MSALKILSFEMPNGAGAAKILTSDASGVASWQANESITSLTGDLFAIGPGSADAVLVDVNTDVGSFGDASHVMAQTVNAKGLTTAASAILIAIASSQVSGLGSLATISNLTGPVTSVGAATAVTSNAITNAMLAQAATLTLKGNNSGSTANVSDLTAAQVKTLLAIASTDVSGLTFFANLTNLTGDLTTSGSGATTLATVNSSPGTTGDASHTHTIAVNAKGLVTSATLNAIQIVTTQVTGFDTQVRTSTLNQMTAPTADLSINTHKITNVVDPTNPQDGATKAYVDAVAAGLKTKPSVLAANTSGNITLSGTQTIDGVVLVATNRVLLTSQTTTSQNGIWLVQSGSWTRPTDFATGADASGSFVFVDGGTNNSASGWVVVGEPPVTIDTTAQSWTQFSGAGEILPGNSLTKSGNTLNVTTSPATQTAVGTTRALTAGTGIATIGDLSADRTIGLATAAANTFKANNTGSSAAPVDITVTQAKTLLAITNTDVSGLGSLATVSNLTGDVTSVGAVTTLAAAGTAGTYGDATHIPQITTDSKGRVTAVSAVLVNPLTGWIDITKQSSNSVLTSNSASVNVTNMNTILAAAPAGTTIYGPGGTYNFNAAWTMPSNWLSFQGQGGDAVSGGTIYAWTSNVAGDLITLNSSASYTIFNNIAFVSSGVAQTAGAVINVNGTISTNIYNCSFGALSGGFLFNCLSGSGGSGSNSWNSSIISGCTLNNYKGTGILINSSGSSLMIEECIIQGQWGGTTSTPAAASATAGVNAQYCGSLQIVTSNILGNVNNLLLNPASGQICSSVFVTNSYLDNSAGSCVKISGAGATVKVRLDTCSLTTAGTNYSTPGNGFSAFEVSSTYAYTTNGQGIDVENCNILNSYATQGTTCGLLLTGAADISVTNCRGATWTYALQITPIATAGVTRLTAIGNVFGPCGGYGANAVGMLLNGGSATYGQVIICGNNLTGNSAANFEDFSSLGINDSKVIRDNAGVTAGTGPLTLLSSGGTTVIAGRGAATVGTGNTFLATVKIPAYSVVVGQNFRIKGVGQQSSTGTTIFNIYAGANGTTSDTLISNNAALASVGASGYVFLEGIVEVVAIGATSTVAGSHFVLGGSAVAGKAFGTEVIASAPTTAPWFITISGTVGTGGGVLTMKELVIEAV